jgi:CheY-like chemotaxis protein
MPRVLVVDDEPSMRFLERVVLEERGMEVEEAASGEDALARCTDAATAGYDAVVLDHRMPGLTGLEVAERLRAAGDATPLFLFSGWLDPDVRARATALDMGFVDKASPDALVALVAQAV